MNNFIFLERLEQLRKRIGAKKYERVIDKPLTEYEKIARKLQTTGIPVELDDINREKIGPFLVYKDNENNDHLAILYIQDSYTATKDELERNSEYSKNTPKFHLTWCNAVEKMHRYKRFERYVLSQAGTNTFTIESKEDEMGTRHTLHDIRLYPCQFCLDQLKYRGFHYEQSRPHKLNQVKNFRIGDFISENYGTLVTWKHLPKNRRAIDGTGGYTIDFPEISRELRSNSMWTCEKCNVNLVNKKEGLHVHHINGVRSDNRLDNLQVLCAICHKNIDSFHKNMKIRPDIESYIRENRPINLNI